MSDAEETGRREVAYRMFAAEFDDADYSYSESDEERAPNYVVTPTGARANRLFVVGVLTEIEEVSDDVLRARVVDPTGAFVLYAGQYQPDEQAFLEGTEPPTFVAVTGKARTFSPEDSEQVYTSIRPESISDVDAETRDRWTVQAAEQSLDRIRWMATALALETDDIRDELTDRGADEGLAHGIELALDHYGTTPTYLDAVYEMAADAARIVAGEKDEIDGLTASPDQSGTMTPTDLLGKLPDESAEAAGTESEVEASEASPASEPTETEPAAEAESTAETSRSDSVAESSPTGTASDMDRSEPDGTESSTGASEAPTEESDSQGEIGVDDGIGGDDIGEFEPEEEFELEEETREEIEEEYGTDFQTGTEVDEPGNAEIETPELDEQGDPPTAEPEPADTPDGTEPTGDAETATEEDGDMSPGDDSGTAEPDDLQEAVVELMSELDSGDGADRDELLAEMNNRYGSDRERVEEAIQSALMDGQCYEPDESSLKPI